MTADDRVKVEAKDKGKWFMVNPETPHWCEPCTGVQIALVASHQMGITSCAPTDISSLHDLGFKTELSASGTERLHSDILSRSKEGLSVGAPGTELESGQVV